MQVLRRTGSVSSDEVTLGSGHDPFAPIPQEWGVRGQELLALDRAARVPVDHPDIQVGIVTLVTNNCLIDI